MEQKELEHIKNGLQYRFDLFKGRRKDYLYFVGIKDYAYFIIGNPILKAFTDNTINAPKVVLDEEINNLWDIVQKNINNLYSTLLPILENLSTEKLKYEMGKYIDNQQNDVTTSAYYLGRMIEIAASITDSSTIQSLCTLKSGDGIYKIMANDKMYYEAIKSKISPSLPLLEQLLEKRSKQRETKLWGSFSLLGTATACVNKIENGDTENPSYHVKEMMDVWYESSPNSSRIASLSIFSDVLFPSSISMTNKSSVPNIHNTNYFLKIDYDFHAQKIHNCLIEFLDKEIANVHTQEKKYNNNSA